MKKNIIFLILFSFLLLFPFHLLMSQDREELRKMRHEKELRETIKVYMYFKMKSALDLTDEQEAEIIPKVEEMEMEKHRFMGEKRNFLKELEEVIQDEKTSDQFISNELALFREMEKSHRESQKNTLMEIESLLSPRQQAKFLLFMADFRNDIKRKIDHVKRMHEQEEMRRKAMRQRQEQMRNSGESGNYDDDF